MFCHNCGKSVSDTAKFCTGCGAKLFTNPAVSPTQQATPVVPVSAPIPEPVPAPVSAPIPEPVPAPIPEPVPNVSNQPISAPEQIISPKPEIQLTPVIEPKDLKQNPVNPNPAPKKKKKKGGVIFLIILLLIILGGGGFAYYYFFWDKGNDDIEETNESIETTVSVETAESVVTENVEVAETTETPEISAIDEYVVNPVILSDYTRPAILSTSAPYSCEVNVPAYTIKSDLSNVYNKEKISYWDKNLKKELAKDGFVITEGYNLEAFSVYESNRYDYTANFVSADTMLHTYHLYFSYLLKNTEKTYLSSELSSLTSDMLYASEHMYAIFAGSEWENSAFINYAYFAAANKLLNPDYEVPEAVASVVEAELSLINAADATAESPLFGGFEDYSQYKPRGYYEFDENLVRYFKTMMWYGRRNFAQKDETMNRCALLMTLALHNGAYSNWESIYTVTSFFAGASDDNGFYEYMPLIIQAYGEDVSVQSLLDDPKAYENFTALTANLNSPMINSIPGGTWENEDHSLNIGFRFMGQRFSIDEAVFQRLCSPYVGDDITGRLLPDVLDLPAAMGSDVALGILDAQGDTNIPKYTENMESIRAALQIAPEETWNASLYANWINTLSPLLIKKGEGYPMFMQNEKWATKELLTFAGSYSELKHDTVLYSKQMIAEMGGGDVDELDDRGYVEPQAEVYARLVNLVDSTKNGLDNYGYLTPEMKEDLEILSTLAYSLQIISEKELRNETPTEEEFELIRSYGGQLEHFWQKVNIDEAEDGTYLTTQEFPAAVISDIATGGGECLEAGTGKFNTIYVVVPVDGQLKLTVGCVYSFYEFAQPASERLTDTEWRQMLGIYWDPETMDYETWEPVPYPSWESAIIHEY